jgi:hypothetical protein
MASGVADFRGLAVGLAAEFFLIQLVPRYPPTSHTYCSRATGRARLQPVWLDRAFRGLSNGVALVGFECLDAGMQNPKKFFLI